MIHLTPVPPPAWYGTALKPDSCLSVSLSLDCVVCLLSELPKGIIAEGTIEGSVPGVSEWGWVGEAFRVYGSEAREVVKLKEPWGYHTSLQRGQPHPQEMP